MRVVFEQRDGVEVQPAELHPSAASARRLGFGERTECGVERIHSVGRKKQRLGRVLRKEWGELAADFGERASRVTVGKGGFSLRWRYEAELGQPVFGSARGEEAAGVLQKKAGELRGRRCVFVREPGDSVEVVDLGGVAVARELGADLLGHLGRAREPQAAFRATVLGVMFGEFFDEAVKDEARVAAAHGGDHFGGLLFVAADRAHGGQAARDGVGQVGDGLAERYGREGHAWRERGTGARGAGLCVRASAGV